MSYSEIGLELVKVVITGLVAAVLVHLLEYRRFVRGRWWDRKADAYEGIIDALARAVHSLRMGLSIRAAVDVVKERGEEVSGALREALVESGEESNEMGRRIVRAAYAGDYLISKRASDSLLELLNVIPDDVYLDLPLGEEERHLMSVFADKVEWCLEIVRAEARKELRARWYG